MISCALRTLHGQGPSGSLRHGERVWFTTGDLIRWSSRTCWMMTVTCADIGITWAGNETFLHSVWVVGPGPPRPAGMGLVMSTPYQPTRDHDRENASTTAQPPTPLTPLTVPDAEIQLRRPPQEICQGYRLAAPIQRFNNKSLNWSAWFRHFRAVADVHGWSKDQRALQLVSYLDETAMNVAQELGDNELYNNDAEQFVRGQSDPELKKHLWVVNRTQKDRKLQTLIEVCTDFSSLTAPAHIHRPAEQTFAVHQQMEASYAEEDCESEAMFAVGDHPPWTGRGPSDPSGAPTLQHMFVLAHQMRYEMRPITRRTDTSRQPQGNRQFANQNRGFCSQTRTGWDYSKFKCFSCRQFGHLQSRCPRPDASLPFKPEGWYLQSDNRQQRDGDTQPGNSV